MKERNWLVGGCVILILISGCIDEARYESLEEAQSAGAFERGWIPKTLPPSATEIRETHVIDTNQTWGVFSYSADDLQWTRSLASLSAGEELNIRPPRSVSWWNPRLQGRLTVASLNRAGLEVLQYRGAPFHAAAGPDLVYFFVSESDRKAYFWRPES